MSCKLFILVIASGLVNVAWAGHSKWVEAKSWWNWKGPVDKHAIEIKIPHITHHHDEHGHGHDHHETHYTVDYYAQPHYKWDYGVEDKHTGDYHSQKEEHDGHEVKGEYSLLEPGGRHRTVKYHAGKDGFHADVEYHGENQHHYALHEHEPIHIEHIEHKHEPIHIEHKHDEHMHLWG